MAEGILLAAMAWLDAARPARQAAPFESGVKPPHFKKRIPPKGGTPELQDDSAFSPATLFAPLRLPLDAALNFCHPFIFIL